MFSLQISTQKVFPSTDVKPKFPSPCRLLLFCFTFLPGPYNPNIHLSGQECCFVYFQHLEHGQICSGTQELFLEWMSIYKRLCSYLFSFIQPTFPSTFPGPGTLGMHRKTFSQMPRNCIFQKRQKWYGSGRKYANTNCFGKHGPEGIFTSV